MNSKILILLGLTALAAAEGGEFYGYGHAHSYESSEAKYDFDWAVEDDYSNEFGHQESRDGDHTKGSYYNHLPDGRLQKVTYYVDGDSGYLAEVEYEGEAHYPSYESSSHESSSFESHEAHSYTPPQRRYHS